MKNWIVVTPIAIISALIFVVAVLTFVDIYSDVLISGPACAPSLAESQWPRFMACAMARHEGLASGLIAAAAALIAGWMAYRSIQLPLRADERRRLLECEEAKITAILALTQPIHAAAAALGELRKLVAGGAAQSSFGANALATAMTYVEQSLQGSMIKSVIPELAINERLLATMIVERLQTFIILAKAPGPYLTPAEQCQKKIDMLTGIRTALRALDEELADVFDRDSAAPTLVMAPNQSGQNWLR